MTDKERERLEALLGMLGSDFDGERANAAKMVHAMAVSKKLSIVELVREMVVSPNASAKPGSWKTGWDYGDDYMKEHRRQHEDALRRAQREARERAERQRAANEARYAQQDAERRQRAEEARRRNEWKPGETERPWKPNPFDFNTQTGDQSDRMRGLLRDVDLNVLNDWERTFVTDVLARGGVMTDKQLRAAMKIIEKSNNGGDMRFRGI